MKKYSTKELTLTALFTALIAIGAFIKIPVPFMDYFTLQFLFVLLAGFLLKPGLGGLSVGVYLFIGLLGFPIFAAGGGFSYVLRPSFGYLLGFLTSAYLVGYLCRRWQVRGFAGYLGIALIGMLITYLMGFAYKYLILNFYLQDATGFFVVILAALPLDIPGDILLCIIAAALVPKLKKALALE